MKHIKGAAVGFGFGIAAICFIVGAMTIFTKIAIGMMSSGDAAFLAFLYSLAVVVLTTIIGALEGA